ncbi:uncharacterized sugar kinase PH1459, partial [Arthrobacter sp. Hiyo6]
PNRKPGHPRPGPGRSSLSAKLIDIVESDTGTIEHPGGSPANVAYGLGRLGVSTGLKTAIGEDRHGRLIREHLNSAGVQLLQGSTSLDRTATATATLAADAPPAMNSTSDGT